MDRWKIVDYELLSFQLTDGFVAVFAEVAEDGMTDLCDSPLQAIGLARVTCKAVEGIKGQGVRKVLEVSVSNELVGLQLMDGYWHIVDEFANFAGLCEVGGDIWNATGSLDRREFRNIRPQST